jgi:alpha-1,6-mannosyl-glycoprotein beta-1,2-N-acetylglucosaminyltransferase
MEREGYNHNNPEFEITPLCKRMWKELNHPLEMFGPKGNQPLELDDNKRNKKVSKQRALVSYKYTIPAVFMVYKRADYLRKAIDSLLESDFPRDKVPIIISHDGHIKEMTDFVESIKSEFHVIQLFHPHACSEHPSTFPGNDPKLNENYAGDTYGNPRDWPFTCCKHHFTWMMNTVFSGLDDVKDADGFLFLEEDYIVAPTVYETIQTGFEYIDTGKEEYFGVTIDPSEGYNIRILPGNAGVPWLQKRFVTGPVAFRRDMFEKIKQNSKEYCYFDDYNW